MDKNEILLIDFRKPIDISIRVKEIHQVETEFGFRIFIQGDETTQGLHVEFFCPSELERILRSINFGRGDIIRIEFFGTKRINGHIRKEFFAEKIEDEKNDEN